MRVSVFSQPAHRRSLTRLCAVILLLTGAFARAQQTEQVFHLTHAAMGTEFTLDLYAKDQATAEHAGELAFDEIDRLEALLSNYRSDSELSRVAREAARGPVVTDPETFGFLERSVYWSRRSNGAFDITVGPLLRAWGFFFHHGAAPTEAELNAVRGKIGWQFLQLDASQRSVAFASHRQLELDPGSIGKGFAVDAVVRLLRENGVKAALISAGRSTVYGLGMPPGTAGWSVKVPDAAHPGRIASTVVLRDTSLSTGACTEKFFVQNGHRYCHIFDPRTMRPVEGVLQSTVIDPSATDSDALSTVAFVMKPSESRAIFEESARRRMLVFREPGVGDDEDRCFAIHWSGNPCGVSANPDKEPIE